MTLIQHIELGSAQSSITFSSIPSTFTDLMVLYSVRTSNPAGSWGDSFLRFNGVTTGYSQRVLFGDGSGVSSFTDSNLVIRVTANGATSNTFNSTRIYIPNYTSSVAKSVSIDDVGEDNATQAQQYISAGLWTGTDPISSIVLSEQGGYSLMAGSSATLYGITKGSDGTTTVS
jgi:hypothetical protein